MKVNIHFPLQIGKVFTLFSMLRPHKAGIMAKRAVLDTKWEMHIQVGSPILRQGESLQNAFIIARIILGDGRIVDRWNKVAVQTHQALLLQEVQLFYVVVGHLAKLPDLRFLY
jgi:hypothetical protein